MNRYRGSRAFGGWAGGVFVIPPFVLKLTDKQRRALEAALQVGYLDTPKAATLDDVAAQLEEEVSPGNAGRRVRIATRKLVEKVVPRLDGAPAEVVDGRGFGEKYDPAEGEYSRELDRLAREVGIIADEQEEDVGRGVAEAR